MANLAVITALAQGDCEIFSDELNHASLIDGIRLCKKTVKIFKHANYDHLAMMLNESTAELRLIVTDGVFSMDGDKADLDTLYELSEKYNAWVIVDDAHGYGVLGSNGLGSLEVTNQTSERVVLIGTLGKSAGLSGAFVVAHQTIVNFIFQTARAYIYTTAALPAISFALLKSLDLIHGDLGRDRRAQLKLLKNHLEYGLLGLKNKYPKFELLIVESSSPIQAVVVGEAERATRLSSRLEELGFRVPGIRPPTVPKGTSRIRLTLSANHTINDVDLLIEALGSCFREEV
jgi:8-amino-7-oxononanoate synthase